LPSECQQEREKSFLIKTIRKRSLKGESAGVQKNHLRAVASAIKLKGKQNVGNKN
jgi:hypothetical protein